jgi:type I restriction enzyme S subunit
MEVKPGYKQTEVGVIPEDWDVRPLGHLIKLQAGYSFRSENFSDIGMPVIRISDIQDGIVNTDSAVCHPPFKIDDDFVVKNGDFLVAMSGATTGKVGVFHSPKPAYQNQRVGRFVVRDDSRTSQLFVGQLVRSSRFGSRLSVLLEQGAQPNVSGRQIESLLFPVPNNLPEQRAIATALSDVDGLLGGLDRLIAKKRDLKQAAMQQLLTSQTRLPGFQGEWEVKRLGDVATFHKGKGLPKSALSQYGAEPCIHYGELFTRYAETISEIISRTDSSGVTFRSVANDVLMPTSDVTPRGLAKASCVRTNGVILGGDILVIRSDTKLIFGSFLSYLIRYEEEQVLQLVTGSTVFHLYGTDMKKFTFLIPPLLEQTAIAEVLTEMDGELAALEQRREKTRALKQAIMQELLTGRIRLVGKN